jgi:hypothetical protein
MKVHQTEFISIKKEMILDAVVPYRRSCARRSRVFRREEVARSRFAEKEFW